MNDYIRLFCYFALYIRLAAYGFSVVTKKAGHRTPERKIMAQALTINGA